MGYLKDGIWEEDEEVKDEFLSQLVKLINKDPKKAARVYHNLVECYSELKCIIDADSEYKKATALAHAKLFIEKMEKGLDS